VSSPISDNDVLLVGTQCSETNQQVCYLYHPYQAAVIISLLKADNRSERICKECMNEMIDKVCDPTQWSKP